MGPRAKRFDNHWAKVFQAFSLKRGKRITKGREGHAYYMWGLYNYAKCGENGYRKVFFLSLIIPDLRLI